MNLFYECLDKMKEIKIENETFIPDEKALFILFHHLIIEKSFWMLFSKKNQDFLLYVMERILEIIDKSNIEKNEIDEKEVSNLYKEFVDKDDVKKDDVKKEKIFNFFPYAKENNLIILFILVGSKGIIQFLLVSAIYIIKCENDGECEKFQEFLTQKTKDDLPRLAVYTNNFKEKVKQITSNFDTNVIDIYDIFIKYIWGEYKTIHSKIKDDIETENKKDKEEEIEKIQTENFKKFNEIRKKSVENAVTKVDKIFDSSISMKNKIKKKFINKI